MSPEPVHRPPWPADRWPTAHELVEYARVTRTDEVLPLLEQLLAHGKRGQACMVLDHRGMLGLNELVIANLRSDFERVRLAYSAARARARSWRYMAVAMANEAIADPDGEVDDAALELAAAITLQDAGFSVETVEHRAFGSERPYVRSVETVDLLGEGRLLASAREDLIASGVDPSQLEVPIAPADDEEAGS